MGLEGDRVGFLKSNRAERLLQLRDRCEVPNLCRVVCPADVEPGIEDVMRQGDEGLHFRAIDIVVAHDQPSTGP